jgi:hypothetical protein
VRSGIARFEFICLSVPGNHRDAPRRTFFDAELGEEIEAGSRRGCEWSDSENYVYEVTAFDKASNRRSKASESDKSRLFAISADMNWHFATLTTNTRRIEKFAWVFSDLFFSGLPRQCFVERILLKRPALAGPFTPGREKIHGYRVQQTQHHR